jgi:hypothetical protein
LKKIKKCFGIKYLMDYYNFVPSSLREDLECASDSFKKGFIDEKDFEAISIESIEVFFKTKAENRVKGKLYTKPRLSLDTQMKKLCYDFLESLKN